MSIEKRELNTKSMRGWSSSFQMEFVSMNRDKMEGSDDRSSETIILISNSILHNFAWI